MDDITAADWDAYTDWLTRGGSHAHPDLYEFTRSHTDEVGAREGRTVAALSAVFAVAQHDSRFRLEAR